MESPEFICNPEIEMTAWVPEEIQEKFGKHTRYYASDGNVPKLSVPVVKVPKIAK
jgi:hypothetical protein